MFSASFLAPFLRRRAPLALLLLLAPVLAPLSGCATAPQREAMRVLRPAGPDCAYPAALRRALAVAGVEGGEATNPMGYSRVDDAAFHEALTESLRDHGLLAAPAEAAFRVRAQIIEISHPPSGYTVTVTAVVRYLVTDAVTGRDLLDRIVTADYTLGVADQFVGVTRFRMAMEGAMRKNISGFLEALCGTVPGSGT